MPFICFERLSSPFFTRLAESFTVLTNGFFFSHHAFSFSKRGIVLTAGGRKYFTCAYVNIRVIRETVHSTLPIEVFYGGVDEIPPHVAEFMEKAFVDVKFIDITKVDSRLRHVIWKGYVIKVLAIFFSSFREVLYLDSENLPIADPAPLFDLALYRKHGALFWPDYCNMHSSRIDTWDVFGLPRPSKWPYMAVGEAAAWQTDCTKSEGFEIESGQLLIDKKKTWKGISVTAFIMLNYHYFLKRLFEGDKQTFSFAFNTTNTLYNMVRKHPISVGRAIKDGSGKLFFCGNTMGQRHPITGDIFFLHRNAAKFPGTYEFVMYDPIPSMWTHLAKQGSRQSWSMLNRDNVPEAVMYPRKDVQVECTHPDSPKAEIYPVSEKVRFLLLFFYLDAREPKDLDARWLNLSSMSMGP